MVLHIYIWQQLEAVAELSCIVAKGRNKCSAAQVEAWVIKGIIRGIPTLQRVAHIVVCQALKEWRAKLLKGPCCTYAGAHIGAAPQCLSRIKIGRKESAVCCCRRNAPRHKMPVYILSPVGDDMKREPGMQLFVEIERKLSYCKAVPVRQPLKPNLRPVTGAHKSALHLPSCRINPIQKEDGEINLMLFKIPEEIVNETCIGAIPAAGLLQFYNNAIQILQLCGVILPAPLPCAA